MAATYRNCGPQRGAGRGAPAAPRPRVRAALAADRQPGATGRAQARPGRRLGVARARAARQSAARRPGPCGRAASHGATASTVALARRTAARLGLGAGDEQAVAALVGEEC